VQPVDRTHCTDAGLAKRKPEALQYIAIEVGPNVGEAENVSACRPNADAQRLFFAHAPRKPDVDQPRSPREELVRAVIAGVRNEEKLDLVARVPAALEIGKLSRKLSDSIVNGNDARNEVFTALIERPIGPTLFSEDHQQERIDDVRIQQPQNAKPDGNGSAHRFSSLRVEELRERLSIAPHYQSSIESECISRAKLTTDQRRSSPFQIGG
jgi:hypothetical protein